MGFFTARDKGRILAIIEYLISKGLEVLVDIQGSKEQFTTRVLKVKESSGHNQLIIEKLYPDSGNSLIQSSPDVVFSFDMKGSMYVFATKYLGINTEYPEYGFIIDFPTAIRLEDRRKEKRLANGLTKFLSVEFTLEGDDRLYRLKVINIGSSGIGFMVGKRNFDLFKKINVGDSIQNVRFFLPAATLTADAVVKHMTLIKQGRFKGSYLVGIESGFLMQLKELQEKLERRK